MDKYPLCVSYPLRQKDKQSVSQLGSRSVSHLVDQSDRETDRQSVSQPVSQGTRKLKGSYGQISSLCFLSFKTKR